MTTPTTNGPARGVIPYPQILETNPIQTGEVTISHLSGGLSKFIDSLESKPGPALCDLVLVDKKEYQFLIDKEVRTVEIARRFGQNQRSLIAELGQRDNEIDELRSRLVVAGARIAADQEIIRAHLHDREKEKLKGTYGLDVKTAAAARRLLAQHIMALDSTGSPLAAAAADFKTEMRLEQDKESTISKSPVGSIDSLSSAELKDLDRRDRKRRHDRSETAEESICENRKKQRLPDEGRHTSRHRYERQSENRSRHRDRSCHADHHRYTGGHHRGYTHTNRDFCPDDRSRRRAGSGSRYEGRSLIVYEDQHKYQSGKGNTSLARSDGWKEGRRDNCTRDDYGERALDLTPWIQIHAVEQLVNRSQQGLRALFFVFLHDSIEIDQTLSRVLGGRVESILWKEKAIGSDRRTAFVNFIDNFEAESYLRYTQAYPEHLHGGGDSSERCPEISVQWATRSGVVKFYLASAIIANGATRLLRVNGVPRTTDYQDLWELAMRGDNSFQFIRQSASCDDTVDYTLEFASISEAVAARARLFKDERLKGCGFLWVTNRTDNAVDLFIRDQLGDGSILKVNPIMYDSRE